MSRSRIVALAACLSAILAAPESPAQELTDLCPCDQLPATTYVAGAVDNYAQPVDLPSRGPELNAAFPNNIWKAFDDATVNAHVGHTFAGLPGDIACAQLEIHLRPTADFSDNDTLYLGLLPSLTGQFAWAIRLHDLPGTGGTWDSPLDPAAFTLDLDNLPGSSTTSLLAQLNADRRLDVLVQDDTQVDYVKLTVRTFPQQTVTVGIADGFAAPTEGTSRGAQLNAAFPTVLWKDLDDTHANRFIGHTFGNVTGNVVQASIEAHLRPHSDTPNNDTLNLGLGVNSTFAFSTPIRNLPGAGGTWTNNPGTTFQLDLAALPGNVNLLPKINADDRLDFLVQDDTAGDYLRLRYRTCPALRRFSGIFSLEDVGPAISTPIDSFVEVTHPGPGRGGINFTALNVEGFCLGLLNLCPDVGSVFDLAVNGTTSTLGPTAFPVGTLSFANNGATTDLSVLFNSPYDKYITVQVWSNNSQVVSYNGFPTLPLGVLNGPVASVAPSSCIKEFDYLGNQCFRVLLSAPTPVQILQGGPAAVGDEIRICRDIIVGTGRQRITSFSLTSEQPGSFTLAGALVQSFGRFIGSVGGASLTATEGAVTASNLGSSGDAGLAIHLDDANAVNAALAPIDPAGTAPAGSYLVAEARGEVDGVADQPLGSLTITKAGSGAGAGFDLATNFTSVGTDLQRMQIFRDGSLVSQEVIPAGLAARSSSWPRNLGKLGGQTECYVGHFPPDTTFTFGGPSRQTVSGDEIRLLAENGAPVGAKSSFSLRGAGLAEFTLTDVAVGSAAGCTPGPTNLCLNGGRFKVEAEFATPNGDRGAAQAVPLTSDTGYFYFFNPANVELVVKALTGCPVNDRFWIFSAGLTNVEVDLKVTDTVTGQVKHYLNPLFTAYPPKLDTGAFATCDAGNLAGGVDAATTPEEAASQLTDLLASLNGGASAAPADKAATGTDLFLGQNRFRVRATFRTSQGQTGQAQAVQLTDDTGYFWFFNQANVEVIIKALNGCGVNSRYWVFAAGLTNVEVVITVTDTANGTTKTYTNPIRTDFAPIQDTAAFATCP